MSAIFFQIFSWLSEYFVSYVDVNIPSKQECIPVGCVPYLDKPGGGGGGGGVSGRGRIWSERGGGGGCGSGQREGVSGQMGVDGQTPPLTRHLQPL